MIGLDTNVIIRYLTQDNAKQAALANDIIDKQLTEQTPGFITLLSLVEITWILESNYKQSRMDINIVLDKLLSIKQLVVEHNADAQLALKRIQSNPSCDFSDALIAVLSEKSGCTKVYTFDKKAVKIGMELLK